MAVSSDTAIEAAARRCTRDADPSDEVAVPAEPSSVAAAARATTHLSRADGEIPDTKVEEDEEEKDDEEEELAVAAGCRLPVIGIGITVVAVAVVSSSMQSSATPRAPPAGPRPTLFSVARPPLLIT
jgi:hypothetical protein